MMKQTLHALGALTIAAALTMLSTACTNDDSLLADEPQASAVKTYTVSIPATMAGDETRAVTFDNSGETPTVTRGFLATEKIHVYNVTKGGTLYGDLQPTNISADGKSCTLTGELSGNTTIEAGDELKLMYNLTKTVMFTYSWTQNGTQAGVVDGAVATVTVSSYTDGVLTTTTPASFQPQQSVFRLKFVDESNNAINVNQLMIESKNKALTRVYYPNTNEYYHGEIIATLTTATTDYIYLAFIIKESGSSGDVLNFTVSDDAGNYYKGTKAAPEGGFKNGKYYYNTAPIQLTKLDLQEPDITWTTPNTPVEPDIFQDYNIKAENVDIALSGTSRGYKFSVPSGGTIRLNGLNATYSKETDKYVDFIYSGGNLNLVINGENTLNCKGQERGVFAYGTLKLSGNGTLTVISNDHRAQGLQSSDYTNYGNVSKITADGYTVTVTEPTNNDDGSYTWVYTVAPVNP